MSLGGWVKGRLFQDQSGLRLFWLQASIVLGGGAFRWSLGLPIQSGQLSHRQSRGLETGLPGSLAAWGLGDWPDPFNILGHFLCPITWGLSALEFHFVLCQGVFLLISHRVSGGPVTDVPC